MKTTGYKLQHAIREATHARDLVASQWDGSLHAFEGEDKLAPMAVMESFRSEENRLAKLQVAQQRYNLGVRVKVLDRNMTLSEVVKLVGGAGRAEKMWRAAAGGTKKDQYAYRDPDVRNKDEVRAARTITTDVAVEQAKRAAKFASALREALQVGNATEIDLEDLDSSLFGE